MDVAGLKAYPVFDAKRADGARRASSRSPTWRAARRSARRSAPRRRWVVPEDVTLVWTAGHLHPGGLYTDLKVTRDGADARPVPLRGEVLGARRRGVVGRRDDGDQAELPRAAAQGRRASTLHATYDVTQGLVVRVDGDHVRLVDARAHERRRRRPVRRRRSTRRGEITHGHLPENDNHGGNEVVLPDARRLLSARGARSAARSSRSATSSTGAATSSLDGNAQRPPVVRPGQSLTFKNRRRGRRRSTTRSPRARRPATARPASPIRSPTGASTSTPASSASARVRDADREPRHVEDAEEPQAGHVHVLLPRPPVHARRVPRRRTREARSRSASRCVALALPGERDALAQGQEIPSSTYEGMQKLTYKFGPVDIKPGQNDIKFEPNQLKPQRPRLHHALQAEPRLHRRHAGVPPRRRDPPAPRRLAHQLPADRSRRARRRRSSRCRAGSGGSTTRTTTWIMNHMIHNLLPNRDKVWITYEIDFVPMTAPARAADQAGEGAVDGRRRDQDLPGLRRQAPVGRAATGSYTFPDDAPAVRARRRSGPAHKWVARQGRHARRHRRAPAPGRPATPTCTGVARARRRSSCSARRPSTGSPRARCRGTSR